MSELRYLVVLVNKEMNALFKYLVLYYLVFRTSTS